MKKLINLASIILLGILPLSAYASYSITPVALKVTDNSKVTSLSIRNESNQDKSFQLTVYEMVQKNGHDTYKESKDLMATPTIFRTKAGKAQLVRVSVKNTAGKTDRSYKLSIKEINPKLPKQEGAAVAIIPEFVVPVEVAGSNTAETK